MNFKEYFSYEKEILEKEIEDYNNCLVEKDSLNLNYNLNLFKKLNKSGKKIRGVLVKLGYKIVNNKDLNYSNKLALAYEIFQTSILIHDDIIDNDDVRRGVKTIHCSNYSKYNNYSKDVDELNNLSKSVAICVGDYGLYLSNKIISNSYKNDPSLGDILNYFNDIVLNTIKGELIDVTLPFESKHNIIPKNDLEKNIFNIYKLKTAYYTIIGPLVLGMILGKSSLEQIKDIEKWGENVGIAFQIQDDILGIYSDEIGKVVGSDIKEFKQTILYSYIVMKNPRYEAELLKYYGNNKLTKDNINIVRQIFTKSGAKEYATNIMNNLYNEAILMLDKITWLKKSDKVLLKEFVDYLKTRNK